MITAILVDDEPKALKSLEQLVSKFCPEIDILATATSADFAYGSILEHRPQLVFLDVAMPNESGFDLLKRLPSLDFELIFVTGFDQYAIQAFSFSAIGYILKPVESTDLINAVNIAKSRIQLRTENERNNQLLRNIQNPKSTDNKIGIPMMEGIEFIAVSYTHLTLPTICSV